MEVLKKIKALREARNYTQKEFASHVDISLSAYRKIEQGVNKGLSLANLERIADILDTTVSILTDNTTIALEPSKAEREKQRQIEKMEVKMIDYRLQILALKCPKNQEEKSLDIENIIEHSQIVLKKADLVLQQAKEVLQPFQKAKKVFEKIQRDNAALASFNASLPLAMR